MAPPVAPVTGASGGVVASDVTLGGMPPPEQFAEQVAEQTENVVALAEACYEERLEEAPGVGGEHRLHVYVSAAEVIRVTAEEPHLDDEPLALCVKEALLAYELPEGTPRGGIHVRFRLTFTPP